MLVLFIPSRINVVLWRTARNLTVARNLLSFQVSSQYFDPLFILHISDKSPPAKSCRCIIMWRYLERYEIADHKRFWKHHRKPGHIIHCLTGTVRWILLTMKQEQNQMTTQCLYWIYVNWAQPNRRLWHMSEVDLVKLLKGFIQTIKIEDPTKSKNYISGVQLVY